METQVLCFAALYTASASLVVFFPKKVSKMTREGKNPSRSAHCVLSHAMMGGSSMKIACLITAHIRKKKKTTLLVKLWCQVF